MHTFTKEIYYGNQIIMKSSIVVELFLGRAKNTKYNNRTTCCSFFVIPCT